MTHEHDHACRGPIVGRRSFVAGGLGGLLSLSIPRWQQTAVAANSAKPPKSCILLWMNGGPSHLDTFDPKPGAATGGPFKVIDTSARDVKICEHLPQLAEQARHLAIVRSMTTK